jgi:hypothetical protein
VRALNSTENDLWMRMHDIEIRETGFTSPLLFVVRILACNWKVELVDTAYRLVKGRDSYGGGGGGEHAS